jgi:hypothetical protein
MRRIPRLVIALVPLGLSPAVALSASASSTPPGYAWTNVKIEAKDLTVSASPTASPHPLTVESLAPAHGVEVHPYMTMGDTADVHSQRVESEKHSKTKAHQ